MLNRIAFTVAVLLGCFSSVQANEPWLQTFEVDFASCVESIGVGLAPTATVQPRVPTGFVPVGANAPVTPIVVRTARCDMRIFGHSSRQRKIVQVGVVIVPPDGTGDINNYTLFYYTDDIRLALQLNLAGVHAQFVPYLQYSLEPNGNFAVRTPSPAVPRLNLRGEVYPSSVPAGSFTANWWQKSVCGTVKMQTTVPLIKIGAADLVLTTPAQSSLATILGGSELTFPLVQQFNQFDNASMTVTVIP